MQALELNTIMGQLDKLQGLMGGTTPTTTQQQQQQQDDRQVPDASDAGSGALELLPPPLAASLPRIRIINN
jgi:hypothetical protein